MPSASEVETFPHLSWMRRIGISSYPHFVDERLFQVRRSPLHVMRQLDRRRGSEDSDRLRPTGRLSRCSTRAVPSTGDVFRSVLCSVRLAVKLSASGSNPKRTVYSIIKNDELNDARVRPAIWIFYLILPPYLKVLRPRFGYFI